MTKDSFLNPKSQGNKNRIIFQILFFCVYLGRTGLFVRRVALLRVSFKISVLPQKAKYRPPQVVMSLRNKNGDATSTVACFEWFWETQYIGISVFFFVCVAKSLNLTTLFWDTSEE